MASAREPSVCLADLGMQKGRSYTMAEEQIRKKIRVSVRNLVEFVLRSGDIDNRKHAGADNAMAEGGRIHRMIQRRMGSEYQAEVSLRYTYEAAGYDLVVEGRADGVIKREGQVTIDEIKGTYRDIYKIHSPEQAHLAQAKCYAYIYAEKEALQEIQVRMTYCNIETEELQYFYETYSFSELREWFLGLLKQYQKWADYEIEWKKIRQESVKAVAFPYEYREGQKELAASVYRTIYHGRKLFLEAPTGVGKTLSTVFPAVKAVGEGLSERIFYFTAKTITRTVAEHAFELLREQGLHFKTVVLTAKDKVCFLEEPECNPDACPYAKGHMDRINDAIFDLITSEEKFSREMVEEYARKHQVCPFEFSLDVSLFSDGIIGDYNYLFDPHVYLKRFFMEGIQGDGIFLVDEAHNLVERGRDMYSALLRKEDFLELKRKVKVYAPKMEKQLEKCNRELLLLKRECEEVKVLESIEPFIMVLNRLSSTMSDYLTEHDDSPVRKEILDFYFEISHFLLMYDGIDDDYVIYTKMEEDGSFILKLFCVDPSKKLRSCMKKGRSSILFSATLIPVQYYKKLLGGEEEDYEVYAASTFSEERRALLLSSDVTSKYTRRNEEEFHKIAAYIQRIIEQRKGNYMVFVPSYHLMEQIYEVYQEFYNPENQVTCLMQKDSMREEDREAFLSQFQGNQDLNLQAEIGMEIEWEAEEERSLLGFCVMGGIFSEGIDLKNDSLIGAILVGTGLPLVCAEREILKEYFEEQGSNGFDYAYRYPGMNKVLQAAGRVIRTKEDRGVIALLDERFLQPSYTRLFPREWKNYEIVNLKTIETQVKKFWKQTCENEESKLY